MIALLLGCASLLVLMGALGKFSGAQVKSIKQMGVWIAAIGGLILAVLLFLTGRGAVAISALVMLGPLLWSWVMPAGPGVKPGAGRQRAAPRTSGMSASEALEVLGLAPGASRSEIQEAYVRLMRAAHPDQGGSDWLAARINQARDVLLG